MTKLTTSDDSNPVPTFGEFAESYITSVEGGWKNPRHRQDWRNTLLDHAKLLSGKPIDQIGTEEVLAVLVPIWLRLPRTARRVRGRIEKILETAKARGFRSKDAMNPAAWRGHLAFLLPTSPRLARGHHAALPWNVAPAFMADLRQRQALAARCLEFVILTAARSGEGLGATWGEIDLESRLWSIPAIRMSSGVEHAVPLSGGAVALLEDLRPELCGPDLRVFSANGAPLSNRAMSMLLRRMKRDSITTHGFRTTFSDWARDATDFPRDLVERALAHPVSKNAERSDRGASTEGLRELMGDWSEFVSSRIHKA